MKHTYKPELLLPAGSLEKLKTAILYGADAVYCGTPSMSLRAKSKFTLEQVLEGIEFAHSHNKKVYLTLNLLSHNKDIPKLPEFVETIRTAKPDGVIVADPAVFKFVKENAPELDLHVSTQASVCSWLGVNFWKDMGAKMCVLGRETSFAELKEIREKCTEIKLETFIHGSMCMSYSGRCLLSNFLAERGANQGNCAHCCRWNYQVKLKLKDGTHKELEINEHNQDLFEFLLEEEFRPGEYIELEETERGVYLMNSKDLCLMPRLNDFLEIGIDSLKIEGRNKTQYYTGMVAKTYRKAIDDWIKDPQNWSHEKYMQDLYSISNRGFTMAFHDGRLTNLSHNYESTKSTSEYEFAGYVDSWGKDHINVIAKNKLQKGDILEFIPPQSENIKLRIYEFIDSKTNESKEEINAGQQPIIKIPLEWFTQELKSQTKETLMSKLPPLTLIRKTKDIETIHQARINLDKNALKIEKGNGDLEKLKKDKKEFVKLKNSEEANVIKKKPNKDFCCGKGCNGCLIDKSKNKK